MDAGDCTVGGGPAAAAAESGVGEIPVGVPFVSPDGDASSDGGGALVANPTAGLVTIAVGTGGAGGRIVA